MTSEDLTKELIKHIDRMKDDKDSKFVIMGNKSYSLNQIKDEIKNQTEFGKEMENNILGLAIDLLVRNKEVV